MDQPKTLTVPEAGRQYFSLGRNASYEAARRGDIPTIRVGRLLRVPVRKVKPDWTLEQLKQCRELTKLVRELSALKATGHSSPRLEQKYLEEAERLVKAP